ncbi:MAG: hypothetical protein PVJ57_09580 [Phycisphaerae bacterium]|jgi:hypothetical protein
MKVELTSEQQTLVLQLVEAALREIGPEIRHTMTSTYKDALKQERRALRSLQNLFGGPEAELSGIEKGATSGLVGTP